MISWWLFSTKSLSEPMLAYCKSDLWEQIWMKFVQWSFVQESKHKILSAKWWPFYDTRVLSGVWLMLKCHWISKAKLLISLVKPPGPWFNIKMTSYQYRKSHCGDKTILRPSYLQNGISYTDKMTSLYWIRALLFAANRSSATSYLTKPISSQSMEALIIERLPSSPDQRLNSLWHSDIYLSQHWLR